MHDEPFCVVNFSSINRQCTALTGYSHFVVYNCCFVATASLFLTTSAKVEHRIFNFNLNFANISTKYEDDDAEAVWQWQWRAALLESDDDGNYDVDIGGTTSRWRQMLRGFYTIFKIELVFSFLSLCLFSFPPIPYLGDEFAICLRYERYDKQLSKQNKNKWRRFTKNWKKRSFKFKLMNTTNIKYIWIYVCTIFFWLFDWNKSCSCFFVWVLCCFAYLQRFVCTFSRGGREHKVRRVISDTSPNYPN